MLSGNEYILINNLRSPYVLQIVFFKQFLFMQFILILLVLSLTVSITLSILSVIFVSEFNI